MLTELGAAATWDTIIYAQEPPKKGNFHIWCIVEDTNFRTDSLSSFPSKQIFLCIQPL